MISITGMIINFYNNLELWYQRQKKFRDFQLKHLVDIHLMEILKVKWKLFHIDPSLKLQKGATEVNNV